MNFKEWLIENKQYGKRSASDAQSRLKRALGFLDETNVDNDTATKLENSEQFQGLSIHIKCQIRRSISLYLEYKNDLQIQ